MSVNTYKNPPTKTQTVFSNTAIPNKVGVLETILRTALGGLGNAAAAYAGGQRDSLIVPMIAGGASSAFGMRDNNRQIDALQRAQQLDQSQADTVYEGLGLSRFKGTGGLRNEILGPGSNRIAAEAQGRLNKVYGAKPEQADADLGQKALGDEFNYARNNYQNTINTMDIPRAYGAGRDMTPPLSKQGAGKTPMTGTPGQTAAKDPVTQLAESAGVSPAIAAGVLAVYQDSPDNMKTAAQVLGRASEGGKLNNGLTHYANKHQRNPVDLINQFAHAGKPYQGQAVELPGTSQQPMLAGGVTQQAPPPDPWGFPIAPDAKMAGDNYRAGAQTGTTLRGQDNQYTMNAEDNATSRANTQTIAQAANSRLVQQLANALAIAQGHDQATVDAAEIRATAAYRAIPHCKINWLML